MCAGADLAEADAGVGAGTEAGTGTGFGAEAGVVDAADFDGARRVDLDVLAAVDDGAVDDKGGAGAGAGAGTEAGATRRGRPLVLAGFQIVTRGRHVFSCVVFLVGRCLPLLFGA